jgi:pimeloyl-ACP methyl ester carboxylesterase
MLFSQTKNLILRQRASIIPQKRLLSGVSLSFDKFSIKPSTEPPVLICHGLFGSKQNWSSLAKAMSNRLSRDVYTIVTIYLFSGYYVLLMFPLP